jgi:Holliday junction resolvase RusA-like endonuclease
MDIQVSFENCDYNNSILFDETESKIELHIKLNDLVSMQSRNAKKEELINAIRNKLQAFRWVICGPVYLQFHWYIGHKEKKETDKAADLDNINKPILDSLCGAAGVIIDDSQVKSIITDWIVKNETKEGYYLTIWINFMNDYVVNREKLFFIRYKQAQCLCFDADVNDVRELFATKVYISFKRNFKSLHPVLSSDQLEFHRTRLESYGDKVMSLKDFNNLCLEKGLSYLKLIQLRREVSKRPSDLE